VFHLEPTATNKTMSLLEPPQQLLQLLRESLPDVIPPDDDTNTNSSTSTTTEEGTDDILAYVAFLAAGLCDAQEFTPDTWNSVLQPYLERLVTNNTAEPLERFRDAAEKATVGVDDTESYGGDDEGAEEVCNLRFKYVLVYCYFYCFACLLFVW
jgi:hypothetical protein